MAPEPPDEDWFEAAGRVLGEIHDPDLPDGGVQFTVSGSLAGTVSFHIVVDSGDVSVSPGRHPQPEAVLGWNYAKLLTALEGDSPLEVAYMSGDLKLEGDQVLVFDGWRSLCRSPQLKQALAALG